MPVQTQKQRRNQERAVDEAVEARERDEEAAKRLASTDAILDEIDELLGRGELVDASVYIQGGGE